MEIKTSFNQHIILLIILFSALFSCTMAVPDAQIINRKPSIYPNYDSVTIPFNIAPLNFLIEESAKKYCVEISGKNGEKINIISKKASIEIPLKKWKSLIQANKGAEINIKIFINNQKNDWKAYQTLTLLVAHEAINSYLVYRLINLGYVAWNKMGIYQRDLSTFNESPIMLNRNSDGNCMNCHSFSKNRPEYFMFHMRGKHGGTIISTPDSTFKVNTKTDYTIASGAYPSWHPNGTLIAYSANTVRQFFHSVIKGNEIFDRESDIIIYDIQKNAILTHPSVSTQLRESLPQWSPDGKFLYFCSAPSFYDSLNYNEVFYDLMKIGFNTENNTWGKVDTVLLASEIGGTISFPRFSPDGRYILFTTGSHGYFTIYNRTSNLKFLDLKNDSIYDYPFNSETVDSYHTWSSNGRWIVFSSKRLDGLTTRPYISYFDKEGNAHRPFIMPQKDPCFYKSFTYNYNLPELVTHPVKLKSQNLLTIVKNEAIPPSVFDQNSGLDSLAGTPFDDKEESLH